MATVLARDGRDVILIERDMKEPDRIIGELLQPGGCDALEKLGLQGISLSSYLLLICFYAKGASHLACLDCLEACDEAQETLGYVIHDLKTETSVHIPYPTDENNSLKAGKAFRHGKFISSLRDAACREPK